MAGAPVLQILVAGQTIYAVIGISGLILIMTERNRLNSIILGFSIVLSLILDFVLIPRFGAIGAAVAIGAGVGVGTGLAIALVVGAGAAVASGASTSASIFCTS